MSGALPERRITYKGFATDSTRWDQFSPGDDDIFICTPDKCGTTWTQAITALLIFGTPDHGHNPALISPWLDAGLMPLEAMNAMLAGQTHRHFLKTHTPLDGIDYYPNCTYIAVYRDPRDVYFSLRNHIANMKMDTHTEWYDDDVAGGFRRWAEAPHVDGGMELFSLIELVYHFQTFRQFVHLPNVHLFHYSDLKADLPGQMQRMAGIFGVDYTADQINTLAEAAGFDHMKKNAAQFAPAAGMDVWRDESAFFNKGANRQWQSLPTEDLAHYDACIASHLPPEDVHWLQQGGKLPPDQMGRDE